METKMNLGCGPDVLEGFVNVDVIVAPRVTYWDAVRNVTPKSWLNHFDFILVNHTFCLFSYDDADKVLLKLYSMLKKGGKLQVVDMSLLKAFDNYESSDKEGFAGHSGTIDEMFCKHLVGFGRKSVYTPDYMQEKLASAGFKDIEDIGESYYDLRPKESFVIEGTK